VSENVQLVDDLRLTVSDLSSALGARKAENEALKRRIEDVSTQYTGSLDTVVIMSIFPCI
jgi:signal transduction histidine kinase